MKATRISQVSPEDADIVVAELKIDSAVPGKSVRQSLRKRCAAAWRLWSRLALPLTVASAFTAYTIISVSFYVRMEDVTYDLGIFTEYVKRFAHLQAPVVDAVYPGENLLGDHFHPIVALLAPFFRIFPTPVTLLVAQALLIAISIIPISRAATELLGRGPGQAMAIAYGFSWAFQEMAGYEFHEVAFAVPLLAFSMSALVRNMPRSAALWALPLVFVKEDQGIAVAAIGLLIATVYREKILGLALAAWGLLWSFLAVAVIIPHFNPRHTYRFLGAVPIHAHGPLIARLLHLLVADFGTKEPTLVLFFLPTLFLALRSPLVLVAVPDLLLRFISTDVNYWGIPTHYNAPVMPVVFVAAIDVLWLLQQRPRRLITGNGGPQAAGSAPAATDDQERSRRRTSLRDALGRTSLRNALGRYGAVAMAAVCLKLAFSHPITYVWDPSTYRTSPYSLAAQHAVALVPDGATVAANTVLLAPLGAKADAYWYGNSALWLGKSGNPVTQYVIFDRASPDNAERPKNPLSFVEKFSRGARYRLIYAKRAIFVYVRV